MDPDKSTAGMTSVRNFLRGRKFPGTVRMTRAGDETPPEVAAKPASNAASAGTGVEVAASYVEDRQKRSLAGEPSTSEEARGHVDDAHLNANVTQLDLKNMAVSPRGERATSPTERTNHAREANGATTPKQASSGTQNTNLRSMSDTRKAKFKRLLEQQVVDLDALRELAWSGVPSDLRPTCWQLLLGYLPPNRERREQILERKRREYRDMVPNYYDIQAAERSAEDDTALRQVIVDVPRTAPGVPFFAQKQLQKSLERILYLWGIRHPASGYVQGINDLVTPFLAVFLSPHMEGSVSNETATDFPEEVMICAEADSYWCLCKLLDGIQDHYTHAQPGIQRTVFRLEELVRRIDEPFTHHLESEGLEFLQFTFRWVNCLLIREIPFQLAIRLWDTYLAEGTRMRDFLTYVLAAFLLTWSSQLKRMEFQELILFLQRLPTADWGEKEVESVLSRAYMWRASFHHARSHLSQ
ncbi:hypothetical protein CVIRNUC_010833 [Coccomyxa viridis]|uniref:Rab-GAP TBC domain-containing protein n=1 Tax=Coccomyxa viridis TaxID=1274662 RepID=A0AAV1ILU8_9CHLO|nr:hypothetical protein CVIRNUC_010833 [Coccomyxa viridis]